MRGGSTTYTLNGVQNSSWVLYVTELFGGGGAYPSGTPFCPALLKIKKNLEPQTEVKISFISANATIIIFRKPCHFSCF